MNTIYKFMQECRTFFVATVDADQPRVRPFGAVCVYEGKLYICANNQKKVSQQIKANPKIEISAVAADGRWLRLSAQAYADDGLFEVYYLANATGTICSFDGSNEVHTF